VENGFKISETIPASAADVYAAWLSNQGHTEMTGSPVRVDGSVGGKFSAWDGYISGSILELEPFRRIVQSWRTTEFPDEAPDSRLEILLQELNGTTTVTLLHSGLPGEQVESYRQGWQDFYFKPMREYFGRK
jgi:activator of HSP90 ATPase